MRNLTSALLTVGEMARADTLAAKAGQSHVELMERAGAAVAREIAQRWSPRRVSILCGPGNNGGDGFVTARYLQSLGWDVHLGLLGDPGRLSGSAAHHARLWPGQTLPMTPEILQDAELVVDALFGAGLNRGPDAYLTAILTAAAKKAPVVAIDVPSGVMGDTGQALGAISAALTVTFFRKKPGHLLYPGRRLCGEVVVADIGIPASVLTEIAPALAENGPDVWQDHLPQLRRDGHKYSRGHAMIWGGYPMTGAARLAGRAAARIGAGLTSIAVPETALAVYAAALTSIMVRPVGSFGDFSDIVCDERITGFLIGPGAGVGEETRARTLRMLSTGRATVLDADALTSFAQDGERLWAGISGPCVLTPHEGEFRRLFDEHGDKLQRSRNAARRSRAVLVLKGADTVIAAPDGRAVINSNAPATLATAGSGDVLSGIILGLLTQGMEPFMASAAGVWLHGEAARIFGPGLIAEDLPDQIPVVLRMIT